MAAHRYWGVHISANWGDMYTALAELVLAASVGGAQSAVGGAAIASSFSAESESPDKAFDGLATTSWRSQYGEYKLPSFIGYDMGAGNALDVAEVRMTTLSSMGSTSHPRNFALVYSDNGTDWRVQKAWVDQSFLAGVERAFDATPVPANQVYSRVIMGQSRRNDQANAGPPTLRRVTPFGPVGGGARHHTSPAIMTPWTGVYFIAGTTTALGDPLARRVALYDQRSGLLVRQTFSKADGVFLFDYVGPGPWTVVGVDVSAEQNSVIYAHVTPSPMT